MTGPLYGLDIAPTCTNVEGAGWRCMIACTQPATGHIRANRGPNAGRCIALVCRRHATAEGWPEVRESLIQWAAAGFFDVRTGGPGPFGAPQVWHTPPGEQGHFDPMPTHEHEAAP